MCAHLNYRCENVYCLCYLKTRNEPYYVTAKYNKFQAKFFPFHQSVLNKIRFNRNSDKILHETSLSKYESDKTS